MSAEGFSKKKSAAGEQISRRQVLKALVGAVGVAAVIEQVKPVDTGAEKSAERELLDGAEHKNISHVETSNATYTIEYNNHEQPSSPESLEGADALILEDVSDYSSRQETIATLNDAFGSIGYSDLVKAACDKRLPIFFVDIVDTKESRVALGNKHAIEVRQRLVKFLETMVGAGIAISIASDSGEGTRDSSRRDFIKRGASGLAAGYLLSHVPAKIAEDASHAGGHDKDESSIARRSEEVLGTIDTVIHPEARDFVVDTRSTLIAQKSEAAARLLGKELGRKPRVALEVGAGHYAIEHELNRTEKARVDTLKDELEGQLSQQSLFARVEIVPIQKTVHGRVETRETLRVRFYNDERMEAAN